MRYIEPLIGFLACSWFLLGSWLAARSLRDWRQKAEILLGLHGMAFFLLRLYGQYSRSNAFHGTIAWLGGTAIGIFITLWLEGSLNILRRPKSPVRDDQQRA